MWRFRRRRRPAASGTLRVGRHGASIDDYPVLTVSEGRHPDAFAALLETATTAERDDGQLRRWATLVPVADPRFGVADVGVEFDGRRACYLRPPHLGIAAARIEAAKVATLEVPALVEFGPAGPTVRLRIDGEPPT